MSVRVRFPRIINKTGSAVAGSVPVPSEQENDEPPRGERGVHHMARWLQPCNRRKSTEEER